MFSEEVVDLLLAMMGDAASSETFEFFLLVFDEVDEPLDVGGLLEFLLVPLELEDGGGDAVDFDVGGHVALVEDVLELVGEAEEAVELDDVVVLEVRGEVLTKVAR